MKDIFANHSRKEYFEVVENFVQSFRDKFPECQKTMEMQTFFNGVVKGSEHQEQDMIEAWVRNMNAPLVKKKVSYAKAVERLIGTTATCYHACCYNDADGFGMSTTSKVLKDLDIENKYKDARMSEEDKTLFWKYIENLNRCAYDAMSEQPPKVPTRDEIRDNIEKHRRSVDASEQPSVSKAFCTSLMKLYEKHNHPNCKDIQNADESCIEQHMNKWATIGKQDIDGKQLSARVQEQNTSVETILCKEFALNKLDDEDWKTIENIYSYATVGNAIPQRMMSRIEDLASKLADDIVSGKKDMNQIDLNDIGQQVLSGCNPDDMQKFAGNLDDLLPVISKFATGHR